MQFTTYTMNENSITEIANQARELFIESLVGEGYLTQEQGRELASNYVITVRRKGWWGRLYDKIKGTTSDDGIYIEVVKVTKRASIVLKDETLDNKDE